MNENIETLITREDFLEGYSGKEDDLNRVLANSYEAEFKLAGNTYNSVNQYLMFQKAITFRRYESSREIMSVKDSGEIRTIADKNHMPLKESELIIWRKIRTAIMIRGVRHKFLQNQQLLGTLLSTGNKVIAECIKDDNIWGIGLDLSDPARLDADSWKGKNVMGRILMKLRNEFRVNMITARNYKLEFIDAMDQKPIEEWDLKAGELKMHPYYYHSIHAYADTLITEEAKSAFYNTNLSDVETVIATNLGGGFPVAGFYELKQDIYDISFLLAKYAE